MNSQISTKLAALGMALMINSFMIGGIAYLFNSQLQQSLPTIATMAAL
jgi:hypothetical protein